MVELRDSYVIFVVSYILPEIFTEIDSNYLTKVTNAVGSDYPGIVVVVVVAAAWDQLLAVILADAIALAAHLEDKLY